MSRYSKNHKDKTHQKIISKAARLFREKGYQEAGVKKVMQAVGLTQGGFYAHFKSKDDLLREVLIEAFSRKREEWVTGFDVLKEDQKFAKLVGRYFSRGHRDHKATGCPATSLVTEIERSNKKLRQVFESELLKSLELIQKYSPSYKNFNSEEVALIITILGTGAIALSRAVANPNFSDKILHVAGKMGMSFKNA